VKLNPMLDLPGLQKSSSLRREPPSTLARSFESQFPVQTRWLPESTGYSPSDSLRPFNKPEVVDVSSPACIFDLSNRSYSTFVGYNRPLVS
jgi:hypothetical protein